MRPSALTPLGGLFSLATSASSLVLGKEYTNLLIYSAEKGIMDEIDEQLRIMNERGIQEEELRQKLIQMRDQAYD